jgi:hypothetical protein
MTPRATNALFRNLAQSLKQRHMSARSQREVKRSILRKLGERLPVFAARIRLKG